MIGGRGAQGYWQAHEEGWAFPPFSPSPNLYPGFPSEDQNATWMVSQAAAPQGEATQAPLVTLRLELPEKENASRTAQEKEGVTFKQKNLRTWYLPPRLAHLL